MKSKYDKKTDKFACVLLNTVLIYQEH